MMKIPSVLLLIQAYLYNVGGETIGKTAAVTNNNALVEAIKENLRRNNDDYAEALANARPVDAKYRSDARQGGSNTTHGIGNTTQAGRDQSEVDFRRHGFHTRGLNSYDSQEYGESFKKQKTTQSSAAPTPETTITTSSKTNKIITWKRALNANETKLRAFFNKLNKKIPPFTKDMMAKKASINKANKLKQFMMKNRDIFKKFIKDKIKNSTKILFKVTTSASGNTLKIGLQKSIARTSKTRVTAQTLEDTPDPELLDMAPAVGGRIQNKRLRGRLCHRHVLFPEGPKYDSRGRWYLPAHELVVQRPYERTRPPRILLPRCCNCCKKSVLGCE